MTCPSCGDPYAYLGLLVVECPNKKCEHWSEKAAQALEPESELERIRRELNEGPWEFPWY